MKTSFNSLFLALCGSLLHAEPEYCKKDPETGRICNHAPPSDKGKMMWYFNHTATCCSKFRYLGCDGNHNRFTSLVSCLTVCSDIEEEYDLTQVKENYEPDCSSDSDAGPCRALIPMWYYNKKEQKCEQFTYGGCQGNGNRFDTDESCQETCKNWKGSVPGNDSKPEFVC